MASADCTLASEFGVSQAVITALRRQHLKCPEHWDIDGHTLNYTAAGIQLLRLLAGAAEAEKKGGVSAPHRPVAQAIPLIIARCYPSRIWIAVRTPSGSYTDIQVKDNARLRERTQIMCVLHEGKWHCAEPVQGKPEILALLKEPKTAPGNGTRPHTKPNRPRA